MTESSENPVYYHFSAGNIAKVTAFVLGVTATSSAAAIIMAVRVWPFGINKITVSLLLMTWLPAIIALWGAKVWWFDFARFLKGAKQLRKLRTILFQILMLGMLVLADTLVFWQTEDVRLIIQHTLFTYLLFGGNSAFTIVAVYLEYRQYRQDYPQSALGFLEYCNQPDRTN